MKIRYFDLGTYSCQEIKFMKEFLPTITEDYEIYGFEGSTRNFDKFSPTVVDEKTKIYNNIVSNVHNEKRKIYFCPNKVGHSIYSSKYNVNPNKFWEVTSIRFSDWIKDNKINLKDSLNIVKINIEGAEWDFFNDIIDNNIKQYIHLFCGLGHDVEKIGYFVENDMVKDYYKLLSDNDIYLNKWCVGNLHSYESKRANIVKIITNKYNEINNS